MSSPCYGCEHIAIERRGFSQMAPTVPYCRGYETKLAKTPDGDPIPHRECEKAGVSEDDLRGCCS